MCDSEVPYVFGDDQGFIHSFLCFVFMLALKVIVEKDLFFLFITMHYTSILL